jgi:hypothetical protein
VNLNFEATFFYGQALNYSKAEEWLAAVASLH